MVIKQILAVFGSMHHDIIGVVDGNVQLTSKANRRLRIKIFGHGATGSKYQVSAAKNPSQNTNVLVNLPSCTFGFAT
jgi:hypothetical protein